MRSRHLTPLRAAARLFPRFRESRPPVVETVRRRAGTGELETTGIGRTYFTTRAAVDRFVERRAACARRRLP